MQLGLRLTRLSSEEDEPEGCADWPGKLRDSRVTLRCRVTANPRQKSRAGSSELENSYYSPKVSAVMAGGADQSLQL